jgi:uncharacterized protein (TIGR02246 family)
MGTDRAKIEASFAESRRIVESGDWSGFAELFAENGTFVNPVLAEPLRGREAIRKMAESWPKVVNVSEWVVIDGDRLVVGWNERQQSVPADRAPYRGISTFVFDDDGLVTSYEGMFDTAAVKAHVAP